MKNKVFILLIVFFVGFSGLPTVYELTRASDLPSLRYFELVHNFPTDFNFYLSRIRQGIEGHLTVTEKYTSEPHQGSFIHVMYLAMGWAGRWVRVPWERSSDVYHVARLVLALTFVTLLVALVKRSFDQFVWQLMAFFLAITASTWPTLVFYHGSWRFGGYMSWWSVMDSLQRITFIPHLLAGQALLIFLIPALTDSQVLARRGNWFFLGALGLLLGIIFPPGLLFVYAVLVVLTIAQVYFGSLKKTLHQWSWIVRHGLSRMVFIGFSFPALFYLSLMTSFYPWKRLAEYDTINPLPFKYIEYIQALGPILPLGLLGLVVSLKKKETKMLAAASWVMAWIMLLVIFHFIPQQSPLRFSEMAPHVPLGILAAYFFWTLFQNAQMKAVRLAGLLIAGVTTMVGFGVMYSSWLWQKDFIDQKVVASYPLVPYEAYVLYPLKDFISPMKFLQDHTSRDTVVLSELTAGNYLPVYSGNTVYVGHANTVKAEEKLHLVKLFFRGAMTQSQAWEWFKISRIGAVYYGPQEMEDGMISDLAQVYPFLKRIYKNSFVSIYLVQNQP